MRRKALDMTQADLAAAASCSVETVRKIESGTLRPSRHLAQMLAERLGVPPGEQADFVRFARGEQLAAPFSGFATASRPGNLRLSPTPFIGRGREVARIRDLLGSHDLRLLTLTGPPGIGKTRLSIEAARGIDGFADGVFFVPLAAVREPGLVLPSIAGVLGVREAGSRSLAETLKGYLQDRCLLLVLDNFEQVVEAGPILSELLRAAPQLKMLVSSRAVLRVYSEHNFVVPPMSLPGENVVLENSEQLAQYEAVQLFASRARAVRPDFVVSEANASFVVQICTLLDGLPLAIELAAVRSGALSPQELLARLGNRLDLLASGMKDLSPRQRTLRGAIAWSDDLLSDEERALFRRFSVFSGGCSPDAAEKVCAALGQESVSFFSVLESLLDKSLLRRDDAQEGSRLWMLETIREYALEKLRAAGEDEAARDAHTMYYLALAERAEKELQGAEQARWLSALENDLGNLRAALRNSLDKGDPSTAARLGSALRRFWYLHGHITEGRLWLEEIVRSSSTLPPDLRAKTAHALGTLAWSQGDYPTARAMFTEGLDIWRRVGNRHGMADMLNNLAVAALPKGDLDEAYALNEEALGLFRELGDRWSEAMSLANLGLVAINRGDYPAAERLLGSSLVVRRSLGDKQSTAQSLNNLGTVLRLKGEYEAACAMHTEALAIFESLKDRWSIALTRANMGAVELSRGDYPLATKLLREALKTFWDLGVKQGIATCLEGLAGVAASTGKPDGAARLFGAAEGLREEIGVAVPASEREDYTRNLRSARDAAVASRFTSSWTLGKAMPLADVVSLALQEPLRK